ncbi:MAG: 16S rRNA (cytosine(1402)-N(4))-methyltransferase RsmH [Phycisphaerales bacterium]|jgi:16S rRNA (cytosine1402-N4)-methyltransferase|nr:16S rRNA (cytosine(1402)-N(4))-methyltransferase RsmH [Phycisphaerales bacterium]
MPNDCGHIPVLPDQVCDILDPQNGDVIVDLTAGRGGHAELLAKRAGEDATLILFDLDRTNLQYAQDRLAASGIHVIAHHASFITAAETLSSNNIQANCVLADLGFSSNQMDTPNRGFSFGSDGPLDMRLDSSSGVTAADLVNSMSEKELADIIYTLGEEPYSRRIAQKIVLEREEEPILNTARLAQLVRSAYGARARSSRLHPATRTFMALRIAVNGELDALDALLCDVEASGRKVDNGGWLHPNAKIAVISFHSLEDRRVKQSFVALEKNGLATRLTRKPIRASDEEHAQNPRSRPAKLRAVKLGS